MMKLAQKYNITIFWFYGEAGHGKGLVDAMSSFGCKQILRSAIISEDKWFPDSQSMFEFLKEHFVGDNTKSYYFIDHCDTAMERREKRNQYKIPGCRKYMCIAFNPYGEMLTRSVLDTDDETIFNLNFKPDNEGIGIIDFDDEDDHDENQADENDYEINDLRLTKSQIMYEMIEKDMYIGLCSVSSSLELFYVAKVITKGVATEYMEDNNGHSILPGEHFLSVVYLEKVKEMKGKIKYKLTSGGNTYVHLGEVFATSIYMSDDLSIDMNEYQSLCAELF